MGLGKSSAISKPRKSSFFTEKRRFLKMVGTCISGVQSLPPGAVWIPRKPIQWAYRYADSVTGDNLIVDTYGRLRSEETVPESQKHYPIIRIELEDNPKDVKPSEDIFIPVKRPSKSYKFDMNPPPLPLNPARVELRRSDELPASGLAAPLLMSEVLRQTKWEQTRPKTNAKDEIVILLLDKNKKKKPKPRYDPLRHSTPHFIDEYNSLFKHTFEDDLEFLVKEATFCFDCKSHDEEMALDRIIRTEKKASTLLRKLNMSPANDHTLKMNVRNPFNIPIESMELNVRLGAFYTKADLYPEYCKTIERSERLAKELKQLWKQLDEGSIKLNEENGEKILDKRGASIKGLTKAVELGLEIMANLFIANIRIIENKAHFIGVKSKRIYPIASEAGLSPLVVKRLDREKICLLIELKLSSEPFLMDGFDGGFEFTPDHRVFK